MSKLAFIQVIVPKGCKKTALNFDAFSSHERDLARKTFIFADGNQLLCRAFKVDANGRLILTIEPECFEIVEGD